MSKNISCPNFRVLAYQMAEKSQFPFFIKKFLFKIENPTSRAPSKPKTYRGVSARGAFDREFDGLSFVEIAKRLGSLLRRTGQFKWINNFMHFQGVNCLSSSRPVRWSVQLDTPLIGCAKVQGTIGSLTTFCSDAPPRLYIARYVADSESYVRKHLKCDFEALRVL